MSRVVDQQGVAAMTVDRLGVGESAHIVGVDGEPSYRRRLMEMGLVPGTSIENCGRSPLGDPTAYRVRGMILSLRSADAALIRVEPG